MCSFSQSAFFLTQRIDFWNETDSFQLNYVKSHDFFVSLLFGFPLSLNIDEPNISVFTRIIHHFDAMKLKIEVKKFPALSPPFKNPTVNSIRMIFSCTFSVHGSNNKMKQPVAIIIIPEMDIQIKNCLTGGFSSGIKRNEVMLWSISSFGQLHDIKCVCSWWSDEFCAWLVIPSIEQIDKWADISVAKLIKC